MQTCDRCGADAMDAQGRCHNCGWQAPKGYYQRDGYQRDGYQRDGNQRDSYQRDSSPSLGETRAADVPAPIGPSTGRTAAVPPAPGGRVSGSSGYGPAGYGPAGRSLAGGLPPVPATGPSTRYCGSCGARIEPGEAFCGQCGTPVSAATTYGASERAPSSAPSRYHIGGEPGWGDEDDDALTEEIPDMPPAHLASGYARSGLHTPPGGPYGGMGYGTSANTPALETPSGSSRTVRIVLGVMCLGGSIVSALVAILLALANAHG